MAYTTTRPRGPIAAQFGSPGPIYSLPPVIGYQNHSSNSRYRKGPAYQFGLAPKSDGKDRSPGPCYSLPSRLYNTGMDGIPAYSVTGRPRDLSAFATPGPGTYTKETSDKSVFPRPPCYSLGSSRLGRQTDNTPAPNAYQVPPAIGKTPVKKQYPSYSITGRSKIGGIAEDLTKTPGPGAYGTVDQSGAPKYSVTGRNEMPGDSTQKPGPGAYNPSYCCETLYRGPSFHFGIRHSPYVAPLILCADND